MLNTELKNEFICYLFNVKSYILAMLPHIRGLGDVCWGFGDVCFVTSSYCFFQDEYTPRKEKRQYKKRKHKSTLIINDLAGVVSSGDDDGHNLSPASPTTDEAQFVFRRRRQCVYQAVRIFI